MVVPAATCPACRAGVSPNARFCNLCGASVALSGAATGTTMALPGAPSSSPAAELPPGTLLGANRRYRIERALGRGGFAQTYLARDLQLKRTCVIKRMLVDPAWSAAEQRLAHANFAREAELLAGLNAPGHPNIPEIYEYLRQEACLVMKYIAGRDLGALTGSIPPGKAVEHIRAICSALDYMHAQSPPVLHRDIKPANILLADDGRVWLIDFGLSRAAPIRPLAAAAGATMMVGTLGYTPPEQWQSAAEAKSDVYALAATLHTLLTGYQPTFTPADLPALIAGSKGAFPPLRSLNPAVDPQVEVLILRAMAFDPAWRPTAGEFLRELDRLFQPVSGQPRIITPGGQSIATLPELAAWCAANRREAAEWLRGNLADVIEAGFLDAQLAKKVRQARSRHQGNPGAALDALIALLSPASPRSTAAGPTAPMPGSRGRGKNRYLPYQSPVAPTRVLKKSRAGPLLILVALIFMVYAFMVMVRNSNRPLHDDAPITQQSGEYATAAPVVQQVAPPTEGAAIVVPVVQPAAPPSAEPAAPRQARITGAAVLNIRAEPSARSADIGDLYPDSAFELTGEEREGWYRIRAGASEGWVNGAYVEILP